jgi:hypothetical protein
MIVVQRIWNVKAVGTVVRKTVRPFEKHLEDNPEKHSSAELQETIILGTASILKKILT